MTQEEIKDYNRRCAEFLGYELIAPEMRKRPEQWKDNSYWEHKDKANVHTSKKVLGRDGYLSFHSDWNWIKSVLEKISSLNEDDFSDETQQAFEDLLDLSLFSSKESVCESINNFIKTEATKQQNNFLMKNYQKNH